ncbi:MAG: hypothetical protein AB7K71_23875 [Polyangiaceae bacterium]
MRVGLVTPPGLLGEFVGQVVRPAGHELFVAPHLDALFEQTGETPDVVLFAPHVDGEPAHEVLQRARQAGLDIPHAIYLGLEAT